MAKKSTTSTAPIKRKLTVEQFELIVSEITEMAKEMGAILQLFRQAPKGSTIETHYVGMASRSLPWLAKLTQSIGTEVRALHQQSLLERLEEMGQEEKPTRRRGRPRKKPGK